MPEICLIPPVGEPIHVEEAKLDRRVIDSTDDSLIRSRIAAARQQAEMLTRRQLLHARWQLTLDRFPMAGVGTPQPFREVANIPAYAIMLPHSPLVRVVSIRYLDMGGVQQTMPSTDCVVNRVNEPALITPVFGGIWPIALPQIGAVNVTYDAGYASPIKVTAPGAQFSVNGPVTWAVGDRVQFYNSGGALPAPLDPDASYLIASSPSTNVYTITDSAGVAVSFTDVGTGRTFVGVVPEAIRAWMLLRVGSMYENREDAVIVPRGKIEVMPFADGLLDPYRTDLP